MSREHAAVGQTNLVWLAAGVLFGLSVSYFWPSETAVASTDRNSGGKVAIFTCEAQQLSGSPDIVFVLDFLTGRLSGASMDIQSGKFSAFYQRNIAADFNLSPETQAEYVVTNGQLNLSSSGGGAMPAKDGIFIAEMKSGLVNCYSFVYPTSGRNGGVLPLVPQAQFSFRQASR